MTGDMEQPAPTVLVVDDERLSRQTTVRQLRSVGFGAEAAENGYGAADRLSQGGVDIVLCDLRMPGMDGIGLLRHARRAHPDVDVLLMTAYGTVETAVEAMQLGAADYLTKPFQFTQLEHRLRKLCELRTYRSQVGELQQMLAESQGFGGIVGRDAGVHRARELIRVFADHAAPVLVTGETGTGKELVARGLHQRGPRARRPFVPLACGAIPKELAESELFGHEKGAFTGAASQRIGAFERANGGTLLLDDVDDLPLPIQAALLRALQEGTLVRVGGSREIKVDVRVVATTKIDLAEASAAGTFRSDLYYRLRGLEIRLPSLRGRGDDVLLLAQHFLKADAESHGGPPRTLSPEAAACLRRYRWPGNVRELRHAMETALVLCAGGAIEPPHLPSFLLEARGGPGEDLFTLNLTGRDSVDLPSAMRDLEDALIQWALRKAGGQQTRAAELLGVARTTLQSKLQRAPNE